VKNSTRIDALKWARFASTKVMMPLEGAFGAYEVYNARPEDRAEVGFEETGAVVGGFLGGVIGGAIGTTETVGSLGLGAPLGVGLAVGGNIGGAAAGRYAGGLIYQGVKIVEAKSIELYEEATNDFKQGM
jgi:hypothetical protein